MLGGLFKSIEEAQSLFEAGMIRQDQLEKLQLEDEVQKERRQPLQTGTVAKMEPLNQPPPIDPLADAKEKSVRVQMSEPRDDVTVPKFETPQMTSNREDPYASIISQASSDFGVPESLIRSVMKTESSGDPNAVSPKGAQGLMQLMPGTAKELGVTDSFDPAQNIRGGVKYLKQMLDKYNGNEKLALAAYNAGPGAVDKSLAETGDIPNYAETRNYVNKISGNNSVAAPNTTGQISPEQELGIGFDLKNQAVVEAANAGVRKATEEAAYNEATSQLLQKQEERMQQRAEERKRIVEGEIQKINELQAKVDSTQINSDQYWENKSTGQKVLLGIALALGTLGSQRTGQNAAVPIIMQAIENDINVQKANLDTQKDAIAQRTGMLNQLRSIYNDEDDAEKAMMAVSLGKVEAEMKKRVSIISSEEQRANAMSALGDIQIKRQELVTDLITKRALAAEKLAEAQEKTQQRGLANQLDNAISGKQPKAKQSPLNSLPDASLLNGMKDEKEKEKYITMDGKIVGKAASPKEGSDIREVLSSSLDMQRQLDRLIELRTKYGKETAWTMGDTSAIAEAKNIAGNLAASYKQMKQMGTLDSGLVMLFVDLLGTDPDSPFDVLGAGSKIGNALKGDSVLSALQAGRDGIAPSVENILRSKTTTYNPAIVEMYRTKNQTTDNIRNRNNFQASGLKVR